MMADEPVVPKTLEQRVTVLEEIVARLCKRANDEDDGLEALFTEPKS